MFDLTPDELQRSIIDSAKEVAGAIGRAGASPWDPIAQSGLLGLGIGEDLGGVGSGAAEEMLALVELGAASADPTVLGAILAAHLLASDASRADQLGFTLTDVLDGTRRLAIADPWHWAFGDVATRQWRVVLPEGAQSAEVAVAVTPVGVGFVALGALTPQTGFDPSVTLARGEGELIGSLDAELLDRALVLRGALQVGLTRRVLEVGVEHASTRHQFGKPIGSFQAVKHHLAGIAVQLDAATGMVSQAAVLIDADRSDPVVARSAAVVAGRAAVEGCRTGIQVHGGIGVTDESDMHGYLRRAHLLEQVFGSPDFHEEWVLRLVS